MRSPFPTLPAERWLVDRRFGVIRSVIEFDAPADLPWALATSAADVADVTVLGARPVDPYGYGHSATRLAARGAAVGESVERYCGNLVPRERRRASWAELARAGEPALDPDTLALFSAEQYGRPGFPFVPFTRDLQVDWVAGERLPERVPAWVPLSLAYLNVHPSSALPTHPVPYAGIATAPTRDRAEIAAIEEVVERDATQLWWLGAADAIRIVDAARAVARLDDPLAADHTVSLLSLPNDFGLPTVAALVHDPTRAAIGFGTSCRPEPVDAAVKALGEAYGLLRGALDADDVDSGYWVAVEAGRFPAGMLKSHRPDRRYLDSFAEDFRDLTDLPGVVQLYLDPRAQEVPLGRMRGADRTATFDALAIDEPADGGCSEERLADYLRRIEDAGMAAYSVDLTTADVALTGLHVRRVIVPGAYGNAPAAYPYLGGRRLRIRPELLRSAIPPVPWPVPLG